MSTKKIAFNKNNPTELLGQLIAVLRKEGLGDLVDELKQKGFTRMINDAWTGRKKRRATASETPERKLYSQLLRLAHDNPEFRSKLLPLLRQARIDTKR